jgi:hypothetical protein
MLEADFCLIQFLCLIADLDQAKKFASSILFVAIFINFSCLILQDQWETLYYPVGRHSVGQRC